MNKLKYVIVYFVLINVVSFILFLADKEKAKRDKWRIRESTLHMTSFLGGAFGSIAAMVLFHHKIRKPLFVIITIIALIFSIFIYYNLYAFLVL
jgi:uncharacterized membrane protein YsdA (DUF1294 family)